jgi:predicted enzyme related to lactoylglutathione lyase
MTGGHVLGIGGVFFRSADPKALRAWYGRVLGLEFAAWGGIAFPPLPKGKTVFSPFPKEAGYFAPSTGEMMLNFAVDDLDAMLARVEAEGVKVLGREDQDAHGRFAWILDPEGMKIELWQPAA